MSFQSFNLSVLAYANNFTVWLYKTEDSYAKVMSTAYFNAAATSLRENDLIILNSADENTFLWVSREGSEITVSQHKGA